MSRVILVLLVLFAVIESPTAVLRCRLWAQEVAGHVVDPCLDDASVLSSATHTGDTTPTHLLDVTNSSIYVVIALFGMAAVAMLYTIKSITISPLTPPPRHA